MHNWFLIALIAPILHSVVNHIDKYILSKYTEGVGVGAIMIFSCLSSVIILPLILFFYHSEILNISISNFFILLAIGFIGSTAFYLYLRAIDIEEASMVIPIFQLIPIFGYVLGFLILGEQISVPQMFSCLLILSGIVLLSSEFDINRKIILKKKVLLQVSASSFLFATHDTLFKAVAVKESFWVSVFWQYLSITVAGVLLLLFIKRFRKDFKIMMTSIKSKILPLNILSEVFYIIGNLSNNFATMLAPVAIVLVVSSSQPFFVFIGGTVISLLIPSAAKEKVTAKDLLHKFISILLITIGSYFLYTF